MGRYINPAVYFSGENPSSQAIVQIEEKSP
jgi:hypothetical protein